MGDMPRAAAHPLRRWLVISFVPAVILSIFDVIIVDMFPMVGLPILAVSALVSAICLVRQNALSRQPLSVKIGRRSRCCGYLFQSILLVTYDAIWATGLMVILVFTWINLDHGRSAPGQVALTCYTSIPYMIGFFIHAYLGMLTLCDLTGLYSLVHVFFQPTTCPNCHACHRSPGLNILSGIGGFRDSNNRGFNPIIVDEDARPLYNDSVIGEASDVDESTGLMAPGQDEGVTRTERVEKDDDMV